MHTTHRIINFIVFQIGWFGIVLSAGHGKAWLAPLITAVILALHFYMIGDFRRESGFILCFALIGWVVDSIQLQFGVFAMGGWLRIPGFCPLWIFCLWLNFATLLHVSLHWLIGRPLLAGLLGAIGGPLAYWSGAKLGAMELNENLAISLISMAFVWAALMPLLVFLASRESLKPARAG